MQHVQQMIEEHGGFEAVRNQYLRIENEPFMRLVIEVIGGPYPNGAFEVSVAHYGEQNGDAMRDPEITFLVGQSATGWEWSPLTFLNDYVGAYQAASEADTNGLQRVKDARLMRELQEFAAQWDLNLVQQGFMVAFRRKCDRTSQGAANGATPALP